MKYELADRSIDIPDDDIVLLRRTLDLNTTQAIALWLFDHDMEDNGAEVPRKSKKRSKNGEEKREIMGWLYDLIANVSDDAELRNPERLLSFSLGDNKYEITLTKKRS